MTALTSTPPIINLLAHRLRWNIVLALTRSDARVQELVQLLKQPPNLVSYHLKRLRASKLVSEHRSAADGRDVYYSLDLEKLRVMYFASGQRLHPALSQTGLQPLASGRTGKRPQVLFLCTHNSARSQMAEAIMRHEAAGRVEVFSAGSEPTEIHPLAVQVMREMGIEIGEQRAKHLDEFRGQAFDYIVTVCDRVRETCPVFPGDPQQIHWSFEDPVSVNGEERRYRAFKQTAIQLTTRINYLLLMIQRTLEGTL
jgi:protein-tyrosine-phosphatase